MGKESDLREKVICLMEHQNKSQAQISRETGLSEGVISQVLNGKYHHNGIVESSLGAWVRRNTGHEMFIDLKNSNLILEACRYAEKESQMVLIVGVPGLGKTFTLKEYLRRKIRRSEEVHYYHVPPTTNKMAIVKLISRKLGLPQKGTSFELLEAIKSEFYRRPLPLVFDEANHLRIEGLEVIRHIYDAINLPVVISGSIQLQWTLTESFRKEQELSQLHSRIALRVLLKPIGLGETKLILEKHFGCTIDNESTRAFHECSAGIVRDLINGIRNAKRIMATNNLQTPDPHIVDEAFRNQLLAS